MTFGPLHTPTALRMLLLVAVCALQALVADLWAQDVPRAAAKRDGKLVADSLATANPRGERETVSDSLTQALSDSIAAENERMMRELTAPANPEVDLALTDSLLQGKEAKTFVPNPTTATWLALVIPGGGQIYNRKFWKLPIIYGGFAGCAYALTWNNNMYKDYSNAYRDAVNENWDSSSIQDLLPSGYLSRVSTTQLTEVLRTRKNRYRRYRDLSIFAFIGVYLLSVVDAYVDAELSNFDISPDLSMSVEPTVLDNTGKKSGKAGKSVGLQCSLKF